MSSIKILLILIIFMLSGFLISSRAQVKVTDGAVLTLDPNSLLELESTNKGLLIPRMAINDINSASPLTAPVPAGMLVFSSGGTVSDGFYYWSGTAWKPLATGTGSQWITNGTSIYYNTGNVGIGATLPAEKLEVNGDIKIGSTTTGTIRATNELVLRQDGDVYGPSILRIRNRTGENGAIFETTDATTTLIDFIFKNAAHQRNIRFESRAAFARSGAPSFHLGGASPDNPTLSLGDNYAGFSKNVRIGDYATPLTALDVNGQITLRTGAANGAILVSDVNGTGTWTTTLPVASGGTGAIDAAGARTNLGLGTLATQSGTFSGSSSGTNTGDQTITLTGDVTGSGTGSFAATVANNAVTYSKMQAVSTTSKLLGSSSATTAVQEISLGAGLSMSGTTLSAAASSFANPTATIGLTATNGSAATAMRSDASPALSQAIVPTWTGAHTWSALGTFNLGLTASGAAVNLNAGSNFNTNINTGSSGAVSIGSISGAASITQRVGTGNFSLDGIGASTYTLAASTTSGTIAIGGTAQTGDITIGSSTAVQTINIGTGTGDAKINLGNAGTTSGSGVRVGSARFTINRPTAPVITGDANITATVAQIFESGIFICGPTTPGGRTFTFPSAQIAGGMVQGLPGIPAIGDVFFIVIINNGSRVLSLASGTGCSIPANTSIPAGESRYVAIRVTSVISNAETVSIYL